MGRVADRSAGRPIDLCDGDWIVYNAYRAYLAVTFDRVSIAGGPMNGIHFFPNGRYLHLHSIRVLDSCRDSMHSRKTVYPDGKGFTEVSHSATTSANAAGSFGELSEAITDSPYHTVDEEAIPVWRHQQLTGQLVNGSLTSINVPTKESGLNKGEESPSSRPSAVTILDTTALAQ